MYQILLSPFHKILYHEWRLNLVKNDGNIAFDLSLKGNLDKDKLIDSLNRLVADNVLLNSHIEYKDEELYWIKNSQIHQLEYFEGAISEKEILLYVKTAFNIEKGPLYRFRLIKKADHQYRLIIVLYHIIIDESAYDCLINEFVNYYKNPLYHSKTSIKEQISNISRLSKKLTGYIENNKDKSEVFWQRKIADIEPLDLKFLKYSSNSSKKPLELNEIGELKLSFNIEASSKLNQLQNKYNLTSYLFGQVIYAILLNRYSGQNKFAISYTIPIKVGTELIYGSHSNNIIIPYDFEKIENI